MAGPAEGAAAGAGSRGRLRASHTDREQVIGALKAAFVQGMLAKHEFDLRVGQTLASRTYAELAALTADLPAGLAATNSPQPSWSHGRQPAVRPGRVIEVATGLYAGQWASVFFLSPRGGGTPWAAPLLFEGFIVYLGVLMICVAAILVKRRDRRSGGHPPQRPGVRGPASPRLPSVGSRGQFPSADPGHWQTTEIVRSRGSATRAASGPAPT
jgi:hypothetical protein